MGQVTLNYGRLHRLELETVTKHVAQARIYTVISLPRQNDAQAVSSSMTCRRHGGHVPGGDLMGQVTLNYNRLHRLELESDTKHVAQARICTVISLPRQNDAHAVSSSMTDDMVATAQEGV